MALLVLPKGIVDYQHFELTSREKGVSVFQERSYNTDNIYLTCHLEKNSLGLYVIWALIFVEYYFVFLLLAYLLFLLVSFKSL